jgi:hypothetical protein
MIYFYCKKINKNIKKSLDIIYYIEMALNLLATFLGRGLLPVFSKSHAPIAQQGRVSVFDLGPSCV